MRSYERLTSKSVKTLGRLHVQSQHLDDGQRSSCSRSPSKVLAEHEARKKRKCLRACQEHRRHFTPIAISTDGQFGREANKFVQRLSELLAERWHKPYSVVCSYVRSRLSIAVVRATHLCLRGSRVPADQISNRRVQWQDGAGLHLFQC